MQEYQLHDQIKSSLLSCPLLIFIPSRVFHRKDGLVLCGKAYALRKQVFDSFLCYAFPS